MLAEVAAQPLGDPPVRQPAVAKPQHDVVAADLERHRIVLLGLGQFTWLKFIHPVRTARWRNVNLPICLIWVVLAGWSVAEHFNPPQLVKLALGVTSVWLTMVGIVMQAFPAKRAARSAP